MALRADRCRASLARPVSIRFLLTYSLLHPPFQANPGKLAMPAPIHTDPDLLTEFWIRVDAVAALRGVTMRRLAGRVGIDESQLSRMRSQQAHTPLDLAVHLARRLNAPEILDDALALVSESVPSPEADPMAAGRAVVDEACGLISEWTAAAPGGIDKDEARALLLRAERQALRLRELTDALVKVVDGPAVREAYRG